ncbi:MAG: hypothetical protein ACFFD5_06475 [Candidatus Thorarchaeota archaeon]
MNAQEEEDFFLQLSEGDELVWEVTELNDYYFRNTFGSEPNFEKGDKIRFVITDLYEGAIQWSITIEQWDYKFDWGERGDIKTYELLKNPIQFNDYIFILTPTDDYLQEAMTNLDTNIYSVSGNSITKRVKSEIGVDYRWRKQFDTNGVITRETVYTYDQDIIIVEVEGGYRVIPFGFYFIGFMLFSLLALILINFRKKKFIIR